MAKDKKQPRKKKEKPQALDSAFSPADPMGSYTGVPEDPFEVPIQDADDL